MAGSGPSLFVTYSGVSGGAERFMVEIAAGLGRPALIACPPGALADAARARGLAVLELEPRPLELRASRRVALLQLAGHAREIRRLVRSVDPELVVAWGMRSALPAVAALRGLRDPPPLLARHHDFAPGAAGARALRLAVRRANACVVNSEAVKRELDIDARVIWPGVDLERFRPPASQPAGEPRALWLGALVAWKRPELALEIAKQVPGLELRIAGSPLAADGEELLAELRSRAAALGARVKLLGRIEDPVDELQRAHLLLHTADREPFGISVAEALACGTPVVAPAAGGPAEIVDDSCGRLYPPGNAAAAADAVSRVLAEREPLSAGARRRAEERLSLARARDQFGALAAELAGPARSQDGEHVSLIAVTHDSRPELEALLASVTRHLPRAEVVVVDSGSSDGSADAARAWPGGAIVIELDNVGYGTAANAGVAAASRPVGVVMNADVELLDSSLSRAAAELLRPGTPERLLAPALVLPDGSRQDSAQHEPGSAPLVLFALAPRSTQPWRARSARRAGWAVGACIAGRTETLERLGPFDPEVFLYAEDLDLGLRAADAGIETWFWPDAHVLHRRAHSTRRAFGGEPFGLLAARRREVVARRRGRARARVDDALQALTFANRLAIKTVLRRDAGREREQLRALRAARRA